MTENKPARRAFVLVPHRTTGGFPDVCNGLKDFRADGISIRVGHKMPKELPELVIVVMGTEETAVWGARALHNLAKTAIPAFGIMSDAVGLDRCVKAGVPKAMGDRLQFAIVRGIPAGVPVPWVGQIRTIRVTDPTTGTDIALVASGIRAAIGPMRVSEPIAHSHVPDAMRA